MRFRRFVAPLLGALLAATAVHADGVAALGPLHCPAGIAAVDGQRLTVLGVVTGQYSGARGSHFTVQDATGAVTVYGNPRHCAAVGDSVRITGKISVYNGLLELSGNTDAPLEIQTLGQGRVPAPVALTVAQLAASAAADGCEPNESRLVILKRVLIRMADGAMPAAGAAFKAGTNYRVMSAGADSTTSVSTIRVADGNCDPTHVLDGQLVPLGPVDVTGTISQYLPRGATGGGGYQLLPRTREDLRTAN